MSIILRFVLLVFLSLFSLAGFAHKIENPRALNNPNQGQVVGLDRWIISERTSRAHANLPNDIMEVVRLGQKSYWDYERETPGVNVKKLRAYLLYSRSQDRYYVVSLGSNTYATSSYFGILEVRAEEEKSRAERKKSGGLGNPSTALFKTVGSWDYNGPSLYALNVSDTGIASIPAQPSVASTPEQKPASRIATRDCTKETGFALARCLAEQATAIGGAIGR